jgi:hypothetical protein
MMGKEGGEDEPVGTIEKGLPFDLVLIT